MIAFAMMVDVPSVPNVKVFERLFVNYSKFDWFKFEDLLDFLIPTISSQTSSALNSYFRPLPHLFLRNSSSYLPLLALVTLWLLSESCLHRCSIMASRNRTCRRLGMFLYTPSFWKKWLNYCNRVTGIYFVVVVGAGIEAVKENEEAGVAALVSCGVVLIGWMGKYSKDQV